MSQRDGFVAATRFGLGARPGEIEGAAGDPRGWLTAQISTGAPLPRRLAGLPTGHQQMSLFQQTRRARGDAGIEKLLREEYRESYLTEAGARTRAQIESDQPFRERLVAFWSNHFTVSVQRPPLFGLAGPFEREAIRPHAVGKFRDMLLAVARHPGMLVYLDNAISIGPNSIAGARRGRGLNENLAREILELHALGVNGGYTQADVVEFAKILTGWSIGRPGEADEGRFRFQSLLHEPGAKTLLGRRFEEAGEREGVEALTMLARHPTTASHVAAKLARHFVADRPPPEVVMRLTRAFLDSDGDLGVLARTLVELPQAWADPLAKVKTPTEFVVSALRATGYEGENDKLLGALRLLGQAPYAAPSPAGWPDTADQWIGPEAVIRRTEWAVALAGRAAPLRRPGDLFAATVAPVATRETAQAIERAPSAADGVALLFASPEFQRR